MTRYRPSGPPVDPRLAVLPRGSGVQRPAVVVTIVIGQDKKPGRAGGA